MSDYPPRVEKSENIYKLWESGEGDMGELAIGLYDLTAHYKALWDDYAQLEARNERYNELIFAVVNKYPDETRHETALRYIQERGQRVSGPAKGLDALATPRILLRLKRDVYHG